MKNKSLEIFKYFCFIVVYLVMSFFFVSAREQDGVEVSGEILSSPVVLHD